MDSFYELNEQQKRQIIDAEMLFSALEQAEAEAIRHRGSMFWREQDGGRYLISLSAHSRQRSHGPASPENEVKYERFTTRKAEVEARLKSLRAKADDYRRMNKALRVGRTPDILIDVLNAMMRYGVSEHFLVVGTHALFAYETAAGVRFPNDVMATQDADLLFDTGKRAAFMEVMEDRKMSFMGLLKKVDKTFERDELDNHTARNASGYEIDLLRRFPPDPESSSEHPLQLTPEEGDLWPVRASMGQKLLSVPRFDQVVVGVNGGMARMRTVHPLDFARIKRELANNVDREPLKKTKDRAQADMVEKLVEAYLPHLAKQSQAGKSNTE
ncbi:MAG: nucleotidyltransferase domain-containing protein [Pseudomonadota bacterium]